jgi:hypothetical protein
MCRTPSLLTAAAGVRHVFSQGSPSLTGAGSCCATGRLRVALELCAACVHTSPNGAELREPLPNANAAKSFAETNFAFLRASEPNSENEDEREWGSGGRGFKSRRPDCVKQEYRWQFAGGAFSCVRLRCRLWCRSQCLAGASAASRTLRSSLMTASSVSVSSAGEQSTQMEYELGTLRGVAEFAVLRFGVDSPPLTPCSSRVYPTAHRGHPGVSIQRM